MSDEIDWAGAWYVIPIRMRLDDFIIRISRREPNAVELCKTIERLVAGGLLAVERHES